MYIRSPDPRHRVFVGRSTALDVLDRVWREAEPGRPSLVVVTGPEGIGKTALIQQLAVTHTGTLLLRAGGTQSEAGLAYGLLEQLLGPLPSPADVRQAGAWLLDEITGPDRTDPVIMVVDDVHWADHESLYAIGYALRRLRSTRLMVVMTACRIGDHRLPAEVLRLFEADGTVQLRLAGLDTAAVIELSERLTARRMSRQTALRLCEHTGGSPLHIRSLLTRLPRHELANPDRPLPVPGSLAVQVIAALARCGPAGTELVSAVAVLGERCRLDLAAKLAQTDDPLQALDQAIAEDLLQDEVETGYVRFPSPMTRAAVYQTYLSPSRRALLHERAAGLVLDAESRLAHRCRSGVGPDHKLADELTRLGNAQQTAGHWAGAARSFTEAARLSTGSARAERLTLNAAESQIVMGTADLDSLTAQVRGLPASALRSYVLAVLELNAGRLDEAGILLEDAGQRAGPSGSGADADPEVLARVAGELALLRVMQGDVQAAAKLSDQALRTAPRSAGWGLARYFSCFCQGKAGGAAAALSTLSRLPAPAAATGADLEMLLGRARLRIWADDPGGAASDLNGILNSPARLPARLHLLARLMLAEADHLRGNWDEALAGHWAALALAGDTGHLLFAPLCHSGAALVLAGRGEWDAAERELQAAAGLPASALSDDHIGVAAVHLAAARGDADGVLQAAGPRCEDLLVGALAVLGRLDEAETVVRKLERRAGDRPSALAAAARARGHLHAARREPGPAATAFETALELLTELQYPFPRALTELDYGAFLRRLSRRTQATGHLETARTLFDPLGARPYLERCDRELAACRGQTHRQARGGLTAQELTVARHAARGLTNRQIARELVVSVKTVEYHLSHIYPKLQIQSRTQLALWLAQS